LSGQDLENDWVSELDLTTAKSILPHTEPPPKVLILYGSLRSRSYSKLLAYEMARILDLLGAEVRVFNPEGLPMKDDVSEGHPKVQELRNLSLWSEGQVWVCPVSSVGGGVEAVVVVVMMVAVVVLVW